MTTLARAKEQFRMQQVNAVNRGILFLLGFDDWYAWWQGTGHYHERGKGRGQYVMSRRGDKGAYEIGNIECLQAQENSVAPHVGKPKSNRWKASLRKTLAAKRKKV